MPTTYSTISNTRCSFGSDTRSPRQTSAETEISPRRARREHSRPGRRAESWDGITIDKKHTIIQPTSRSFSSDTSPTPAHHNGKSAIFQTPCRADRRSPFAHSPTGPINNPLHRLSETPSGPCPPPTIQTSRKDSFRLVPPFLCHFLATPRSKRHRYRSRCTQQGW